MAHTPGPWICAEGYPYHAAYIVPILTEVRDIAVGEAKRYAFQIQDETVEANARLIAAAPELLEALKGLLTVCDCEGLKGIDVRNARAAIAKAEGHNA